MSAEDNPLYSKKPFLLTLKGWITVYFMDGQSLEGEIAAQDELNIWLTIDDTPHLISRSQIRTIKGTPGQQIEPETTQDIPFEAKALPFKTPPASPPEPEPITEVAQFVAETEALPFDADSGGTLIIAPAAAQTLLDEEKTDIPVPVIDELADTGMTVILGHEAESTSETAETKEHQGGSSTSESIADSSPVSTAEAELPPAAEIDDESTFVLDQQDESAISAYLVCTTGPHAGEVLKLKHGITTLGRSSESTFPLPKDKEASRRHTLIVYEASKFVIQDQNSLNGTFVNDELVKEPRLLEDGDIILIGVSTLKFQEK
jgi:pSer/pThr/pTyr-binding forkhead associated (FHA) protein/sRNA-binding regulator protein Hfq